MTLKVIDGCILGVKEINQKQVNVSRLMMSYIQHLIPTVNSKVWEHSGLERVRR